jgi:hypothetical protein
VALDAEAGHRDQENEKRESREGSGEKPGVGGVVALTPGNGEWGSSLEDEDDYDENQCREEQGGEFVFLFTAGQWRCGECRFFGQNRSGGRRFAGVEDMDRRRFAGLVWVLWSGDKVFDANLDGKLKCFPV